MSGHDDFDFVSGMQACNVGFVWANHEPQASLHGVVTADQVEALAARNAARAEAMRQRMGRRYALHPANKVQRKTERSDMRWFGPRIHIHDQAGA